MVYLIAFGVLALLHLVLEEAGSKTGRYVTKPFLIPLLALWYFQAAGTVRPAVVAALILCWLGDLFLMIPGSGKRWFTAGLGSFLLGHLAYILAFLGASRGFYKVPVNGFLFMLIFMIGAIYAYRLIVPKAGKMKAAVTAYIFIFMLMGFSSVIPLATRPLAAGILGILGALVFMLSDIMNGLNRFVRAFPHERLIVMATYLVAQVLMIAAFIRFS